MLLRVCACVRVPACVRVSRSELTMTLTHLPTLRICSQSSPCRDIRRPPNLLKTAVSLDIYVLFIFSNNKHIFLENGLYF